MKRVDLHIHTTKSDGILSPAQIVEWASIKGVHAIAITDHDTIEGIEEAIRVSNSYSVSIIPGIEISCIFEDEEIHILGYYIDYSNKNILKLTKVLKESRINRSKKIINKLNDLGFDITFKEVQNIISNNGVIGRPHIAKLLAEKKYVQTVREAFDKYIGKNKPAYVERFKLSVQDGIKLIHNAGGIAVIAHPGLIKDENRIFQIIDLGIDGIEAIHSKHSQYDVLKFSEIAHVNNLIITGGSDFHEEFNKGIPILGDYFIDFEHLELLSEKAKSKKERNDDHIV